MVITVEPTIIRDDGIFEVEEDVAVTTTGYELLSHSGPELRRLG